MKLETSQIKKVSLTEVDGLDSITVILENYEQGKGKIIIECYGKSWSSSWGAMCGNTIEDFFCRCDEHYLAGNLSPCIRSELDDLEGLANHARDDICSRRRELELRKEEARKLWGLADDLEGVESIDMAASTMSEIFGDEWWYSIPAKPNPDYEYLCKIIKAVQSGLTILKADMAA